jgi:hypothetical protein
MENVGVMVGHRQVSATTPRLRDAGLATFEENDTSHYCRPFKTRSGSMVLGQSRRR